MTIPFCLAMTAHELAKCKNTPALTGYLACHFSPSGPGLSNMPNTLPPGSVLILDDCFPLSDHQADVILQQLAEFISTHQVQALVLDFQRSGDINEKKLAEFLWKQLPCPLIAPPEYAPPDAAILLPPCPVNTPLAKYIALYKNRRIWLEIALDGLILHITPNGCTSETLSYEAREIYPRRDEALFCHYKISKTPEEIIFALHRTREDIPQMLEEAERLGISHAIGLWQELK